MFQEFYKWAVSSSRGSSAGQPGGSTTRFAASQRPDSKECIGTRQNSTGNDYEGIDPAKSTRTSVMPPANANGRHETVIPQTGDRTTRGMTT